MNEKIIELARQHSVPSELKLERRMERMQRMTSFYESKIGTPDIPEKQANMFNGFVSSLLYAMTMIKMYRKLTKALNELAEEATNEIRTNSES